MNLLHACFAIFAFGLVYANSDEVLPESKLFGGLGVFNRSNFSYQASLRYGAVARHECGGVLYDNLHVLTTARCVANNLSDLTVALGNMNKTFADEYTVIRSVIQIKLHEEFNSTSFSGENDIAILTLNETVTFNANISSIPLWDDVHPQNNTMCVISGWGYSYAGAHLTDWLSALDVNYISDTTCKSIYGDRLYDGMICAGGGGKGPCIGDYGGPLVCNKKLLGLITSIIGQCGPENPPIYTDITSYITWIKNNTQLLF